MRQRIASRLSNFDSSKIRAAFEFAEDIPNHIDLSIGYPEDDTPDYVKIAAVEAIKNNHTRYTSANGLLRLRAAIAKKLETENGIKTNAEQIAITPGITMGIFLAYLALLDLGDEVLLPEPFFPPYNDLAAMLGARVRLIDTVPTFQLTADKIERHINAKSKILVINSPNNPSGAVYAKSELQKIAKLAKQHNLFVISDEVYEHFTYEGEHFSIGSIYPDTLTLNGFSKSYAMTGWRVGYINGPRDVIDAINELLQYTIFSSPSISQHAALGALKRSPRALTKKYQAKRDDLKRALSVAFPDIQGAQGAFYFFVKLPAGVKDMAFVNHLAHKGVIVLPGSAFSHYNNYVRIAYGAETKQLETAVKRICGSAETLAKTASKTER